MAALKLENVGKKAAWVYPEVQGANPPERWGHSACFSQGMLYVFGGCRGGLHFSDVMSLDLTTMSWSSFACTGQQPGTRDSHSAVLHGRKMVIFGGTNGSNKINDVHILDLDTHVWSCPTVEGQAPPPRESHSATLVDGNRVVIFGGTGEGDGNYLNDIHILELDRMRWVSPAVNGELPVCRDSHTAVAVKDQLVVYGGDCGDRYLSEVDVFNLKTFTWSKIDTAGSLQPAVRAGHVAVAAENKVYVFGGVGDRAYYNDVWVLDLSSWKWSQAEVAGLQPQGRFSHVAVLRDDDIAIYGGCGEDERPLDEVLVLHLGIEQLNPDFPKCKFIQTVYDMERRKPSVEVINDDGLCDSETKVSKKDLNLNKTTSLPPCKEDFLNLSSPKVQGGGFPFPRSLNDMADKSGGASSMRARARKLPFQYMEHLTSLENGFHAKKRKTTNLMGRMEGGVESEQDEASPTMSQHPSPTLSDQDKACPAVMAKPSTRPPAIFLQHQQQQQQQDHHNQAHKNHHHQDQQQQHTVRFPTLQLQLHLPGHPQTISLPVHESSHLQQSSHHLAEHFTQKSMQHLQQQQQQSSDKVPRTATVGVPNIVGSEVRGIVDGAFDSGYLMTAQINGQVFRGVLFCPGPSHAAVHRPPLCNSHPKPSSSTIVMAAPQSASSTPPSPVSATLVGYPVHFSNAVAVDSPNRPNFSEPPKSFHHPPPPDTSLSVRPVQIMGGFPAIVGNQSGRWVWQPGFPPQQQPENGSNLSIISVPVAVPVPAASPNVPPFPSNLVTKNPAAREPDSSQPAVTLSLGQSTHAHKI
ncbi:uncharacterized protein LOC9632192 [Selaginella moellendorffii]|uniref:uncharacterized protein LOC9632192 n=1 Tax=Selaginella moellendorffii TaxID=88036 RepID=UPI000D1CAF0C|nr:uncharacterized protein LOC9632192 [Selaginella moellendorffii]XP_024530810.1 uncharacterized protein LOC9632192 [Selaginella moellendorffii]XP_024530811.1 uncharacterized protein LOC9632192 [Selaginella moellendorffii]XP_024530812.1 uncharacterized protein LOC9632192 [Selaginella moellendorffii]|eukprot:XP_024530809.1 uncharacterized protein LOC9632192 [Selaginella moellendorffii]